MSLVTIKNLLFPRSGRETEPLLPTISTDTPQTHTSPICGPADKFCPHPECPHFPRRPSVCSSTTTSSATTKPWLDARTVSDAIIGLSDGLTVPFALTAGLSAFNDTRVVIFGGCAELIAGSISMGLGGWLAGRGEAEFYNTTLAETRKLVSSGSPVEGLVYDVFRPFGIGEKAVAPLVVELLRDETATVDFLMSFHHSLPPGNSSRTPLSSALTIAAGYFLGGFVPLSPYFFVGREEVMKGLWWSVGVMAVCLFVFGVGRSVAVGEGGKGWKGRVRGGVEMVVVGGVAAGASWGIVKALGDGSG